jgi:hypothetical protein
MAAPRHDDHTHDDHAHTHATGGGRPLVDRRTMLRGSAAAAALALVPGGALAGPLAGTSRSSRLGRRSQLLVHSDLHNHTQFSDAAGDPSLAYGSMRDAGLDVAALTDHTVLNVALAPYTDGAGFCAPIQSPPFGTDDPCTSLFGMSATDFATTARYADAVNNRGRFTALRGFEWSSPYLGHVNVWFTRHVTDPLETAGLTEFMLEQIGLPLAFLPQLIGGLLQLPGGEDVSEELVGVIVGLIAASESTNPDNLMTGFYDWLQRSPASSLGGGADGIAGFNHPNREPVAFDAFAFDGRVREQMVSLEMMNRREDYLFKGFADGMPSPLVTCLDAGWRVGLTGVTDEHGVDWGEPEGKGRTGMYVTELSRSGVLDAMRSRRLFATRERGLRLDVAANGATRMGEVVPGRAPVLEVEVDLGWADRAGMPVELQFLGSGDAAPSVLHVEEVVVPSPDEGSPMRVRVPVDRAATSWVVLRVADPARPNLTPGPAGHPCNTRALAYASPLYLAGARPRRSGGPRPLAVARSVADARQLLLAGHA